MTVEISNQGSQNGDPHRQACIDGQISLIDFAHSMV